jgi:uncharacterized protein YgbK (DUF1537 family)
MIETLIIADDLSGAADCAIACVTAGAKTVVIIDPEADTDNATAVSVDVNSRAMEQQEAGAAVVAATERLYVKGTRILYQKMDSTLRGHWAEEMVHIRRAAAKVLERAPLAIVAPAFPGTGRATIDGHVFVNGTPLEETVVWRRAGLSGPADLRMLLTQAGLKVELAKLEQLALGSEALKTRLVNLLDVGCDAVVCDAQTEDDLLTVAAATLALPQKPLWVGSAGLMRALVRAGERKTIPSSAPARDGVEKTVLVVVGSASGASHTQFDTLTQAADISCLVIPPSDLRPDAGPSRPGAIVQVLTEALVSGSDAAVMIGNEEVDFQEGPQLAAALAALIAPCLSRVGGLVVTGGETARAVLVEAGISGLRMLGEIEPGVPVGLSIGEISIPIITKAGAFGDPTTLIRCRAALRGDRSGHPARASGG